MNKKIKAQIIMEVVGAIAFASLGFVYFTGYGGNNCDQPPALTCDCFCCHLFNSRGYESCGIFGLILGTIIGVLLVLWVNKYYSKNRSKTK